MAKNTKERACIECRRRRIKCGRQRPECDHCARKPTLSCKYPAKEADEAKEAGSNGENEVTALAIPAEEKVEQEEEKAEQEEEKAENEEEKAENEEEQVEQEEKSEEKEGKQVEQEEDDAEEEEEKAEQEEKKAEQREEKAEQEEEKAEQEEVKVAQEEEEMVDLPKTILSSNNSASGSKQMNATEDEGTARFKAMFAVYLETEEEAKQLIDEHNEYLSALGLIRLRKSECWEERRQCDKGLTGGGFLPLESK